MDVDGCFQQQRMWHWKGLTVSSFWVSILRHIQVVFPRQHLFLAKVWAPGMQWLIIQGAIDILCKQVSKSKWRFVVHCGPTSQALRVMNFSWNRSLLPTKMDTNNTRLGTYCGLPLVDREPYCLFEACMDMDEKKWFNHQLHQLPNWKFVGRASSTPTSALVVIATAPSIGYDKVAAPMSWWEMAAVTKSNKQIYLLYLYIYISLSHAWIKKKKYIYLSIYPSIHLPIDQSMYWWTQK